MPLNAKMAMAADFLGAFAKLPRAQQRGVRRLLSKFEADPTGPGMNYETIKNAGNPNMRSLRVDRSYRAIVLRPNRGDTHVLLWADQHDKAYAWAERHACDINPETGAMQIYQPSASGPHSPLGREDAPPVPAAGPFTSLRRRQLVRLGVPEAMVQEVYSATGEADLEAMSTRLPREAYEGLFLYLAGDPYDKIILDREATDEPVDIDNYDAALRRDESKSRFVVVQDEVDLEAILNAPLEKWRVFLHPSQRKLVERDWNGPVRVLGAAGTGKTVVAMHRARWLAGRGVDSRKILFVTFSKNLATDIRHNLSELCTPEELGRIEVRNLDAWVASFLRGRKYTFKIVYGRLKDAWELAFRCRPIDAEIPEAFYEAEWEQVVQAEGISTEAEYLRVSRVGRGVPLNRAKRRKIWKVFDEYKSQLIERECKEVADAFRDAVGLIDPSGLGYSAVIVDEAQDLNAQGFRLLRKIVPEGRNDLFITGDCHQRIYGRPIVLGRCGINIRGRSRKLRLNYRTTEQTRAWAARLLEGRQIDDLDGGTDDNEGIQSLTRGPAPDVRNFATREEQSAAIVKYLQGLRNEDEAVRNACVVTRTSYQRDLIAGDVRASGLDVELITAGGDDRDAGGVRVATMHRVKGLEFDRVILASANAGVLPHKAAIKTEKDMDQAERAAVETQERCVAYVAASRAKKELLVFSYGAPSPFLTQ